MLILELTFEFFAGKMLNSRNAFSIVESFKNEFVLAVAILSAITRRKS